MDNIADLERRVITAFSRISAKIDTITSKQGAGGLGAEQAMALMKADYDELVYENTVLEKALAGERKKNAELFDLLNQATDVAGQIDQAAPEMIVMSYIQQLKKHISQQNQEVDHMRDQVRRLCANIHDLRRLQAERHDEPPGDKAIRTEIEALRLLCQLDKAGHDEKYQEGLLMRPMDEALNA